MDWGLPEAGNNEELENEKEELSDLGKRNTMEPDKFVPGGWKPKSVVTLFNALIIMVL